MVVLGLSLPDFLEKGPSDFSELALVAVLFGESPGKSEVANLDGTVGINQEVAWLDVSVHNVGGVDEVQGAERVVHNCDDMLFLQRHGRLRAKEFLHVALNEFHDQKHMVEPLKPFFVFNLVQPHKP